MSRQSSVPLLLLSLLVTGLDVVAGELERVRVFDDERSFGLTDSGKRFVPWGFNYDHDENGRLIEDYWEGEWSKIESDFGEMKKLGANVARIHLQFGKFMDTVAKPNERSLARLDKLVRLAAREGLYLNLTGLGCYHKKDVPDWYDRLGEKERWAAQARFWEAVAKRCAKSPAIFCYDLMNEPVVPGGKGKRQDWLGPAFAGKHFVQFVALELGERERAAVARDWTRHLVAAIRKHDRERLITVGLVPWSLERPGLTSGFVPKAIVGDLDFISVHIYPEKSKPDEALETLKGFAVGKPVVIEEMFPLKCSADELGRFIDSSREYAAGWFGFYWGRTPEECRASNDLRDALTYAWLELFLDRGKSIRR